MEQDNKVSYNIQPFQNRDYGDTNGGRHRFNSSNYRYVSNKHQKEVNFTKWCRYKQNKRNEKH